MANNNDEVKEKRGRKGPRNKPTLSCTECVSRKTKCDRGRPQCFSCVRRQTSCSYSRVAEMMKTHRHRNRRDSEHMPPLLPAQNAADGTQFIPISQPRFPVLYGNGYAPSDGSASSPRVHREKFTLFPPFEAKQHPFGNYWTCIGGLGEVVGVLPNKDQADLMVQRYFEFVDPLYPIVSRPAFSAEYEYFWNLPREERANSDAAHIALQFAMYACASQHLESAPSEERTASSEFYISASHQALCLYSYLNRCSLTTIQSMILICYFLINNNHVSDAWTLSGMTQRLAYGIGLHRAPDELLPGDPFAAKQQRCRLWHATMFQDTNLCLYVELPPATLYHDLDRTCLEDTDDDGSFNQAENTHKMDVGSPPEYLLPMESEIPETTFHNDVNYLQATWDFAQFAQTHLCIPKALRRAVCRDAAHKAQLTTEFRRLHQSWAWPFNILDPTRFEIPNTRLVLQLITVTSISFWMLVHLHMDSDDSTSMESNIHDALEAAHEGLAAFFALIRIQPSQAEVWGANHTRAYDQATIIATILASHGLDRDPKRMLAKSDLERYIDIIMRSKGSAEFEVVRKKRLAKLEALRTQIVYM